MMDRPRIVAGSSRIGPRTMNQLIGALPALDVTIDEEIKKKLDAIFPGPGGEAPQAYAW